VQQAYSPGLRVTARALVRRERRLPLHGTVLAQVGDAVRPADVVARTELPGNLQTINVALRLGIEPARVPRMLVKPVGADVRGGEVVAVARGLFGLGRRTVAAPAGGYLESVSPISGQVTLREPPLPVEVQAYVQGTVVEILPNEGVVIEARGALLQGIFGVGGETWGELAVPVASPDAELSPAALRAEHRGGVVVCGARLSYETVARARELGVAALIAGGLDDIDLRRLLGRELGVAITGAEEVGITILLTEGFGRMRLAERAWELLHARVGRLVSVSGATQIRAGVLRPEVLIPDTDGTWPETEERSGATLAVGSLVRAIREPFFGRIGRVVELPSELGRLETEAMVKVLTLVFGDDGTRVRVPRANVEIIGG
jgi:hypothetical protein